MKDLFSLEVITTTNITGITNSGQKVVGIGVVRKELLAKDIGLE